MRTKRSLGALVVLAGAGIATTLLLATAVSAAPPILTASATNAAMGQTVQATAQLSESPAATGTISFEVFGPGDPTCAGPAVTPTSATVAGEGQYVSGQFTPPSPGVYHWSAHYSGDPTNAPASSTCTATSTVSKATPAISGDASDAAIGSAIHDQATLTGGASPSGEITFSIFAPADTGCAASLATSTAPIQAGQATSADYVPQQLGEFRWTASYPGDANNGPVATPCGAPTQTSVVDLIPVTLTAEASGAPIGGPIGATATIGQGTTPGGQLTFKAFAPGDTACVGTPALSSTTAVAANGKYSSATFAPTRAGAYRWTVAYSGDATHAAAAKACGAVTSNVAKAAPSIGSEIRRRVAVGTRVRDIATLAGGYLPSGTIVFRIYAPGSEGCDKPAFINTVAITGNGSFASDPFLAPRPGLYRFVASYSGDAANQEAAEPCGLAGQQVRVYKRKPTVTPRAALIGRNRISIRARLAGTASPSGVVNFRLYRPGDNRCQRRPAFSGGLTVTANRTFTLAEYLATKPGIYRLRVGYSGDPRNKPFEGSCAEAQPIRIARAR